MRANIMIANVSQRIRRPEEKRTHARAHAQREGGGRGKEQKNREKKRDATERRIAAQDSSMIASYIGHRRFLLSHSSAAAAMHTSA